MCNNRLILICSILFINASFANAQIVTQQYDTTVIGDGKSTATAFRPALADIPGFVWACVSCTHKADGSPVNITVRVKATGDATVLVGNKDVTVVPNTITTAPVAPGVDQLEVK